MHRHFPQMPQLKVSKAIIYPFVLRVDEREIYNCINRLLTLLEVPDGVVLGVHV